MRSLLKLTKLKLFVKISFKKVNLNEECLPFFPSTFVVGGFFSSIFSLCARRLCVAINVQFFATAQTIRSHTKIGVFCLPLFLMSVSFIASSSFSHKHSFRLAFKSRLMAQTWTSTHKNVFAFFCRLIKKNSLLTCTIAVSTENFSSWRSLHGTWERRWGDSLWSVLRIVGSWRNRTKQCTSGTRLFVWRWRINNNWRRFTRRGSTCDNCRCCGYVWRCYWWWSRVIHLRLESRVLWSKFSICFNTEERKVFELKFWS